MIKRNKKGQFVKGYKPIQKIVQKRMETRRKNGWFKNIEETKIKMGKSKKGKPSNSKGKHWKVKDTSNMKGKICLKKTRNKISKGNLGKKRTEEMKKKYKESKIGLKNPMFGKHPTKETIEKMASKLRDKKRLPRSEKWCNNIRESKKGEKSHFWKGGISLEPYGLEFNEDLKEVIRNRDRRKCFICERTELEIGYKLHCHHIDYNKLNNDPKNLISLCRSCHTKTNHNRKYWIAYFNSKIY